MAVESSERASKGVSRVHERNSLQRQRVLRSLSPRLGPSFDVSSSTTDEEEEEEEEEASEFIDLHAPARRAALERTERKEGGETQAVRRRRPPSCRPTVVAAAADRRDVAHRFRFQELEDIV